MYGQRINFRFKKWTNTSVYINIVILHYILIILDMILPQNLKEWKIFIVKKICNQNKYFVIIKSIIFKSITLFMKYETNHAPLQKCVRNYACEVFKTMFVHYLLCVTWQFELQTQLGVQNYINFAVSVHSSIHNVLYHSFQFSSGAYCTSLKLKIFQTKYWLNIHMSTKVKRLYFHSNIKWCKSNTVHGRYLA